MPAILLLSTADTDLLAARASDSGWVVANPSRTGVEELPALLSRVDLVVVRLLGGSRSWADGLDAVLASGLPVVCLGGETTPDAALQARSTVASGAATQAAAYLADGGAANLAQLAAFLSDTVLLTGVGFDAPVPTPSFGVHGSLADGVGPVVGIVYYRSHELAANTAFVDTLADAVRAAGGRPLPVWCASLRGLSADDATGLAAVLAGCDVLITTVLAAGGATAAAAHAGGAEDAWDAGVLAQLDVPVLQGLCLTTSRAQWLGSSAALNPMDAAMQVAIPEFDGRLIGVPFSFKEPGPDGVGVYTADPERAARLAGIAVRLGALRHKDNAEKKLAIVLSSYPTKHARVGNAVGLDTPASAVVLLRALREHGYDLGGFDPDLVDGDGLVHRLIASGGHDVEWLTSEQMAAAEVRVPVARYREWFAELPAGFRAAVEQAWGPVPGTLYVDGDSIYVAALTFGNVVLIVQPPRGFGENPVAIYHDPELAPSHQYLAAYQWLRRSFGIDAAVHLGKHGTLEWLPGKGIGLSADCAPDAVLGDVPLVYPFIVNDPGEGTQAKRRAHAVVVDHLIPPMARADSYGELAQLEQLLDEYAVVAALDPDKVPVLRAQIWELITAAQLHRDLHTEEMPAATDFDDFVLHVDGYLCEVKDVQIRDGLHVLGRAPEGAERNADVLAILRAKQVFGGVHGAVPGLRNALCAHVGLSEDALLADPGVVIDVPPPLGGGRERASLVLDRVEQTAMALVTALPDVSHAWGADVARVLEFARDELVPRLARTTDEVTNTLRALDGRFVEPGPSGSPTRGLVSVLPTGRNFYSVDPKAIPSRNAWDVGVALADSLIARHVADTGAVPRSVGLTVWGTSAMRTQGDDIAEVLALLGCRPTWDDASRRVTGFEVLPLAELGRPRVDVVVRISGFFRDAFGHVITLLDEAVRAVADLAEDDADNFIAASYRADLAEHGDARRASTRIFGSKPGAYGAGLLPLIDARNWRDDSDLAEVYATWGGYAYGAGLDGVQARGDMERSFARIQVAAKNVDTREHDIVDSDDYFQYHGGMVAMVRHLTGADPAAYVGDSAVPHAVKTRALGEETLRVFRSRVVNPKWVTAMARHGYKGAFELAATVDYLFGYDATAGVVQDWMYEKLAQAYVFDPQVRSFMEKSNPWALRGITERLLEAADRGMWADPAAETLAGLRSTFLQLEGELEGA